MKRFTGPRLGFVACACIAMSISTAHAADFYACNAPGTVYDQGFATGSAQNPWKTVDEVSAAPLPAGSVVKFCGGSVFEGTLVPKDGVTYTSYGTGQATISGSTGLDNLTWTKVSVNGLPADAPVYVAHVPVSLLRTENDVTRTPWRPDIEQLIFRASGKAFGAGLRLTRARYPNAGQGAFDPPNVTQKKSRYAVLDFTSLAVDTAGVTTTKSTTFANVLTSMDAYDGNDSEKVNGAKLFVKVRDYALRVFDVAVQSNLDQITLDPTWNDEETVLTKGNGYWLENKLWMLDAPGEWHLEPAAPGATTRKLYVYLAPGMSVVNARIPGLRASVRVHALSSFRNDPALTPISFKLSQLTFEDTRSHAIAINGKGTGTPSAPLIDIDGVGVRFAGRAGISVKNVTSDGAFNAPINTGLIQNSSVRDSQQGGIELYDDSTSGFKVTGNQVRNSGIGYFAFAGIWMGHRSIASGNTIVNSANLGLAFAKFSTISNNVVVNSCMDFNDCGGIYVNSMNNGYWATRWPNSEPYSATNPQLRRRDVYTTVKGNIVAQNTAFDGLSRQDGLRQRGSQIKGIYLDDLTAKVTVTENYIERFDTGVMLHLSPDNTITKNGIFGNFRNQIWLQEDHAQPCEDRPYPCTSASYMNGNVISENAMAIADPGVYGNVNTTTPEGKFIKFKSHDTDNVYDLSPLRPTANPHIMARFSKNKYATYATQIGTGPKGVIMGYFEGKSSPTITDTHLSTFTWRNYFEADDVRLFQSSSTHNPVGVYNLVDGATKTVVCPNVDPAWCGTSSTPSRYFDLMPYTPTSTGVRFPIDLPSRGWKILAPY